MRRSILLTLALAACGGEDVEQTPPVTETPPVDCLPGELTRDDGSCQPAGLPPDMPCAPGELETASGCQAAGVPEGGCAEGFELAADGGCVAVLPASPCAPGQMALPGETRCRAPASCGSGTWGDIANASEHVDGSFAGVSDGSAAAPWTTIAEALAAAESGAVIAIAAGSYVEDLVVHKPVTFWGRCPGMVEVVGAGAELATFFVQSGAAGTVLRGLSITGPDIGLIVTGATDVKIEQSWIHDTGFRAVDIEDSLGTTSVTISDSLIERGVGEGIFQAGSTSVVERSVVRDNQPEADGLNGRGIGAQPGNAGGRASLTVRSSVVEQNHEVGITVIGSDATVDATLVRDNLPQPGDGGSGWGLWLNHDGFSMQRSNTVVRASVIEGNHDAGVAVVGSDATLESTTVRRSRAAPYSPYSGMGIAVRNKFTTGDRAVLTLSRSIVTESHGVGIFVLGGDALLEGSVVRDTKQVAPPGDPIGGRGLSVEPDPMSDQPSTLAMIGSVVERNADMGVMIAGSTAAVEASVVRDTAPDPDGRYGRGLNVQLDVEQPHFHAYAEVRRSLFERNHEGGISVIAAAALVEASIVRDTLPRPVEQTMGRGVLVQYGPGTSVGSDVTLRGVLVENSVDTGVFAAGAQLVLEGCVVRGTRSRPADGLLGDALAALDFGVPGTAVELRASLLQENERAGASNFSCFIHVEASAFDCNAFDLAAQQVTAVAPSYDDRGDNRCGCGAEEGTCRVSSATIEAPSPIE